MSSRRPLSYIEAVAWALAVALAWFGAVHGLSALGRADPVTALGVRSVIELVATFGILAVYVAGKRSGTALALRPTHAALPVIGLALGLLLEVPTLSLRGAVDQLWPPSETELARLALAFDATRPLPFVIFGGCVAPLADELLLRGAIFGALRRTHAVAGSVVVTTLCAVASLPELRRLPELVLLSALLGYLRAASGSLLPCLSLAVGLHTVAVGAALAGVSTVTDPLRPGVTLALSGFGATAVLVALVQYIARSSPEAERARAEDCDES